MDGPVRLCRIRLCVRRRLATAFQKAHDQRDREQGEEDVEEDLRNACRSAGNSAETECAGDDRDYKEYQGPV